MPKVKKRTPLIWRLVDMSALLLVVGVYAGWALLRPLPPLTATDIQSDLSFSAPVATLPWPNVSQAAIAVVGNNKILSHGEQTPLPTASVAKVITALTVLQKKPLRLGEDGPTLTLGDTDVAFYYEYAAKDGSLVAVNSGEQISEYQVLQAMLLPSANNMADSLAVWAFGSLDNYRAAAQLYVKSLGMSHTTIGTDASGYNPDTVSTAEDLVKLGIAAEQNPVIASIADQSTATIPVAGQIYNVNVLLHSDGIIGIKTGNTDQAGGVFLGAAKKIVNGKELTFITAIMGAPDLRAALINTRPLTIAAAGNFANVPMIQKGAIIGHYQQAWGGSIPVVVDAPVTTTLWRGTSIKATLDAKKQLPVSAHAGMAVGTLTTPATLADSAKSVQLSLQSSASRPSLWWQLTHPLR